MALPGAVLFPHALMPLYIFEPRYREMIEHCLEAERMFCIALVRPGAAESSFFHTAGLGLIRACVKNADGTSNLVLQGLRRISLLELVPAASYRVARVRDLPPLGDSISKNAALAADLTARCADLLAMSDEAARVRERLAEVDDPEILSDVVAHTFVQDALERQQLLQEASVTQRLEHLLELLS